MTVHIHPSADVSGKALIGEGSKVWHQAQVREEAQIGQNCIIGKGVYIDTGVKIGDNVKIQNYVSIYHGVVLEDGVFVGPHVCFTNDLVPRAIMIGYWSELSCVRELLWVLIAPSFAGLQLEPGHWLGRVVSLHTVFQPMRWYGVILLLCGVLYAGVGIDCQ